MPYWGLRDYGVDGQLGLERSPDEYLAAMVGVFREVKRVLHPSGTLWLNIGDSYNQGAKGAAGGFDPKNGARRFGVRPNEQGVDGLKPKDLCGIPWRLALALQADGWWLRSEIIWAKLNPMPESVTDRPTKAHEQVFLLSKAERYFYDAEAVREGASTFGRQNSFRTNGDSKNGLIDRSWHAAPEDRYDIPGRNLRTVWSIPTESFPGSHFATFPRKLVEPCIKAGTSERGCCPECGAPWEREVESERVPTRPGNASKVYGPQDMILHPDSPYQDHAGIICGNRDPGRHISVKSTVGWHPTCSHGHDPIPCIVLDPFIGSGTTIVVADALGRRGVGMDLSRDYLGLARRRIERPHAPVMRPAVNDDLPLFAGSLNP